MVGVLSVVKEDLSRAELLEVVVIQAGHDNMVYCILGVGDRNLACMAGHLKVTVCRYSLDPGSEGFCGLLRQVLGLVEMNRVGG